MTDRKEKFKEVVENSTREMLEALKEFGLDPEDPNFIETPARVARAYVEIFAGLMEGEGVVDQILQKTFPFPKEHSEMIIVGPVNVWTVCAHHLLPVELNIWLGYLPKESVLGLSKLARLAEILSKKPGLQEDVTSEIADALYSKLNSHGSGCLIRGRHLCMAMRGVKKDSITTTTQLRGDFLKPEVRAEFLATIRADLGSSSL